MKILYVSTAIFISAFTYASVHASGFNDQTVNDELIARLLAEELNVVEDGRQAFEAGVQEHAGFFPGGFVDRSYFSVMPHPTQAADSLLNVAHNFAYLDYLQLYPVATEHDFLTAYYDAQDICGGILSLEDFVAREAQRIVDNTAADEASNAFLLALQIQEAPAQPYNHFLNTVDATRFQAAAARFHAARTELEAMVAQHGDDVDVHLYDPFYDRHMGTVLEVARNLQLGERAGALTYDAGTAMNVARQFLTEHGHGARMDAVAGFLPGFFHDLSDADRELFARLVPMIADMATRDVAFVQYLATIPENWETQGGCMQGRRNRTLIAMIRALRACGL